MIWLTSNAIIVAVHLATIAGLAIVNRRSPGCACGIAPRPIIAGLRSPCSYEPEPDGYWFNQLDDPRAAIGCDSNAHYAHRNAEQGPKDENLPSIVALLRTMLAPVSRRRLDRDRSEGLSKRHRNGLIAIGKRPLTGPSLPLFSFRTPADLMRVRNCREPSSDADARQISAGSVACLLNVDGT